MKAMKFNQENLITDEINAYKIYMKLAENPQHYPRNAKPRCDA